MKIYLDTDLDKREYIYLEKCFKHGDFLKFLSINQIMEMKSIYRRYFPELGIFA